MSQRKNEPIASPGVDARVLEQMFKLNRADPRKSWLEQSLQLNEATIAEEKRHNCGEHDCRLHYSGRCCSWVTLGNPAWRSCRRGMPCPRINTCPHLL